MRRDQLQKHWNEIVAFKNGVEILYYQESRCEWVKKDSPLWDVCAIYVIDDEHVEARKVRALGEPIQQRILWADGCPPSFNREWRDFQCNGALPLNHNGTKVKYRPTPKWEPKQGEMIAVLTPPSVAFVTREFIAMTSSGGYLCWCIGNDDTHIWGTAHEGCCDEK